MTPHVLVLEAPADPRYASLVPEIASRFIELMGGPKDDGAALAAALVDAIGKLAPGPNDAVELTFDARGAGLEVTLRSGGKTVVVRHPLPAGRS